MPRGAAVTTSRRPLWSEPAEDWTWYADFLGPLTADQAALLPDFLIVAPPKTGTTWVAANLGRHPEIYVPPEKELHYFDNGWRASEIARYVESFAAGAGRLKGEATPTYALLPEGAIRAIHALKPDLKLIMLLRRPPERIWSHLKHCALYREDVFRDTPGGIAAIDERACLRFVLGDYARACTDYRRIIDRWAGVFGDEQMLVADIETLAAAPEVGMSRLFRFLGVEPPADWSAYALGEAFNVGVALPIPTNLALALESIYAEPSAFLLEELSRRFGVAPAWTWSASAAGPWPLWVADDPDGTPIQFDGRAFVAGERRAESLAILKDGAGEPASAGLADRHLGSLIDALSSDMQRYGVPKPSGDLFGFNLFASETRAIAVEQSLGEVDIELDDDRLRRQYAPSQVILGRTVGEVAARVAAEVQRRTEAALRRAIDAVGRTGSQHHGLMDRRFSDLEATIAERTARVAALEATATRLDARVQGSEGALQERTARILSIEAGRSELLSRLTALETTLSERTQRLAGLEASVSDRTRRLLDLEGRAAALERDARARAMSGDLPRRLAARLADAEAVASEAMRELAAIRRERLAAEVAAARAAVAAAEEEVSAAVAAAAGRRSASVEAIEERLNVLTSAFKSAQ